MNNYFKIKNIVLILGIGIGLMSSCQKQTKLEGLEESKEKMEKNQKKSDFIPIYNFDDLNAIRNQPDQNYVLEDDIEIPANIEWIPISNFTGSINGKGHIIENLKITKSSNFTGLFDQLTHEETFITNLGFKNAWIEGGNWTGILAGMVENVIISNITIFNSHIKGKDNVGGIAGTINDGIIFKESNIYNSNIKGETNVGGLVGYIENTQIIDIQRESNTTVIGENAVGGLFGRLEKVNGKGIDVQSEVNGKSNIGGVIGIADNSHLEEIYFIGEVQGKDSIGGLIGKMYNTKLSYSEFFGGTIKGTGTAAAGAIGSAIQSDIKVVYVTGLSLTGLLNVGGIIGMTNKNTKIQFCTTYTDPEKSNTINGFKNVGGLVGELYQSSISQSKNAIEDQISGFENVGGIVGILSHREGLITNVASLGKVAGLDEGSNQVGGILGYQQDGILSKSYSSNRTTGTIKFGSAVGYSNLGQVLHVYGASEYGLTIGNNGSAYYNDARLFGLHHRGRKESYLEWDFDEIWEAPTPGKWAVLKGFIVKKQRK